MSAVGAPILRKQGSLNCKPTEASALVDTTPPSEAISNTIGTKPVIERLLHSLNSNLRDELLNGEIFTTLREAQMLIENWRRHYNAVRPLPRFDIARRPRSDLAASVRSAHARSASPDPGR